MSTDTTDTPSLFFGDARECKAWLSGIAASNAAQGEAMLLDALRVFNRAEFDPLEYAALVTSFKICFRWSSVIAQSLMQRVAGSTPVPSRTARSWLKVSVGKSR